MFTRHYKIILALCLVLLVVACSLILAARQIRGFRHGDSWRKAWDPRFVESFSPRTIAIATGARGAFELIRFSKGRISHDTIQCGIDGYVMAVSTVSGDIYALISAAQSDLSAATGIYRIDAATGQTLPVLLRSEVGTALGDSLTTIGSTIYLTADSGVVSFDIHGTGWRWTVRDNNISRRSFIASAGNTLYILTDSGTLLARRDAADAILVGDGRFKRLLDIGADDSSIVLIDVENNAWIASEDVVDIPRRWGTVAPAAVVAIGADSFIAMHNREPQFDAVVIDDRGQRIGALPFSVMSVCVPE